MPGAYYYQTLTQPIFPKPPAPITLNHWHVDRIPYLVPPRSPQPSYSQLVSEVRNIFPIPNAGGSVTLGNWYVERLPYIVAPPGRIPALGETSVLSEDPAPFPPATVFEAALHQDDVVNKARAAYMARYGVVSVGITSPILSQGTIGDQQAFLETDMSWFLTLAYYRPQMSAAAANALGGLFKGLLTEKLFPDKWLSSGSFPYPAPRQSRLPETVGPIFPIPFVPTTVNTAPLFLDFPYAALNYTYRKSQVAAQQNAAQAQTILQFIQSIGSFQVTNYTVFPNRYPSPNSALQTAMGDVRSPFPVTIPPPTFTIASFFQEWFPQWQPTGRVLSHANIVSLAEPVLPQPFVPATVTGLPWWQQETFQQWTASRYDWMKLYSGGVQPTLPIPFIPPPPTICTAIPPGEDASTFKSAFVDSRGRPIAVLFCLTCKSGLPLLVRGDFAIWCQTCCAFVPRETTVMVSTRAPKFFRGVF